MELSSCVNEHSSPRCSPLLLIQPNSFDDVMEARPGPRHRKLYRAQALRIHPSDRAPHVLNHQGGWFPARRRQHYRGLRKHSRSGHLGTYGD
jgi:hypothetical protein